MKTGIFLSLVLTSISIAGCKPLLNSTAPCEEGDYVASKADSKILFISRRIENSADWNLYSMNVDGSDQFKITDLTVRCEKVVVSHSGRTVLFVHNADDYTYELYSIDIDGTDLNMIDSSKRYCGSPDWSVDDSKIIYSKSRNESTDDEDLILYDVATHTKQTLTDSDNNFSARFSPENNIAFCRQTSITSDIFLMNPDGSDKHLIINNASCPVWSPGGKRIAYISTGDHNSPQIFVACSDGSNSKQLTSTYLKSLDSGFPDFGNANPQWTPDGKKIVYESETDNGLPEIYIMNCDGTNRTRLASTERRNEQAVVSADGNFIIFESNRDLNYSFDIFKMSIDGKNQNPLSKYTGDDSFPVLVTK